MQLLSYISIALLTLVVDGTLSTPVRTARKSQPIRAPLSSSLLHPTEADPLGKATSSNDHNRQKVIHRLQSPPDSSNVPRNVQSSAKASSSFWHDNYLPSKAGVLYSSPSSQWGRKRLRSGVENQDTYKQARTELRTEKLKHDAASQSRLSMTRAAKRASQLKTKMVIQDESSSAIPKADHTSDESTTSSDLSRSSSSSSTQPSWQPSSPSESKNVDQQGVGSSDARRSGNSQATSSSLTVPKDKNESRWSEPKYSTASRNRRKRLFQAALKANNLSVHRNTPQEYFEGILNLKVDDDGELTKMAKSQLATKYIERYAPNQAYKKAYFDHAYKLEKEKDRIRARDRRQKQRRARVAAQASPSKVEASASANTNGKKRQRKTAAKSSNYHGARNARNWQRVVNTIHRLEAKGHDFKGPLDELERSTHGVSLDDVDAAACSRMINLYVRRTRGEADWQTLTKLKDNTSKLISRKKANALREQHDYS
jgi:hypothetical protein